MNIGINDNLNLCHVAAEEERLLFDDMQQIAGLGWWQFDFALDRGIFSDFLTSWLGLKSNIFTAAQFLNLVRADHRLRIDNRFSLLEDTDSLADFDETFPIQTSAGYMWVRCKVGKKKVKEEKEVEIWGFIQKVDSKYIEFLRNEKSAPGLEYLLGDEYSVSHSLLSLLQPLDTSQIVNEVLTTLLHQFDGDRVCIFSFNPDEQTHSCVYEVVNQGVDRKITLLQHLPLREARWMTTRILNQQPVILNSVDEIPPEARKDHIDFAALGVTSMMMVPLLSESGVWGYMRIGMVGRKRVWSRKDYEKFAALSTVISICLRLRSSQKKAEAEKIYFENLYRNMPVAYIHIQLKRDCAGHVNDYFYLDINPAFEKIVGKSAKDMLGKSVFTQQSGSCEEELGELEEIAAWGKVKERDYTFVETGQHFHLVSYPMENDCIVILFVDMTGLVQANEALRLNENYLQMIYKNIPVGIEVYDRNGNLQDVNQVDLEIFGVEKLENVLGVNLFDNPNLTEMQREALKRGENVNLDTEYNFSIIDPDYFVSSCSGIKNLSVKIGAILNEEHQIMNYLGIVVDHTNILRASQEAKRKAEESDRLKSAFLANMSHEIRTPLNAIVGFSNLVMETDDPDLQKQYNAIIRENNEVLLQLINDVLDLSKIEAGTIEIRPSDIDVNMLCQDLIQTFRMKVPAEIDLLFGDHIPECRMYSDKNRVSQVLSNFISNALKFTKEGYIRLGYRITGDEIKFYVQDTGIGIAKEMQDSIFDRFIKLDSFVRGTGLGLSICKSITDKMGGSIGVDSQLGQGSCFWIRLPYNQ